MQTERKKMSEADVAAIVSGGLDSTVLVYDLIDRGYTPHMLSFNYGQRHSKELRFAEYTAKKLGLRHDIVDLTGITHLISNSALTSPPSIDLPEDPAIPGLAGMHWQSREKKIEVPEGHYAEDTMKATVVPNRNMIMLSIAAAVAVNNKYKCIATGVHGGDHFIYPDCRPDFIDAVDRAIVRGNEGFHEFDFLDYGEGVGKDYQPIYAPYINKTKADIAYRGIELNVPFEETWSCYKGGDKHCGRCGTCVERLEAIDVAESIWFLNIDPAYNGPHYDKTEYEDTEFWKEATRT
jgi:7-cyano-7-deazaguanine synthase